MTFIAEKLTEEAAAEWIKKMSPTRPMTRLVRQLVDHERGVVYLALGGRGFLGNKEDEPRDGHVLYWKGQFIRFSSFDSFSQPDGLTVNVVGWTIPGTLRLEKEQIKEAFEAAITVFRASQKGRIAFNFLQAEPL